MATKAIVRITDIKRVIRAATESGLTVSGLVLAGDEVRILFGESSKENKTELEASGAKPLPWPPLE